MLAAYWLGVPEENLPFPKRKYAGSKFQFDEIKSQYLPFEDGGALNLIDA